MAGLGQKNRATLAVALGVAAAMVGLSFASVPLYRKICQVTGWGGTTQEVRSNPYEKKDFARTITVRFNADTSPDMPWEFKPDQNAVTVKIGKNGIVSYTAVNRAKEPVTGTAVYNVTPLEAGKFFYKTQCFCFGEQTLGPGQTAHMPVVFFVDPKIMDDYDMKDLKTITLSYTFYKKDSKRLEKAIEKFTDKSDNPSKALN